MKIVFSTFNARYSHTALALRCLRANLGDLHDRSEIIEFEHSRNPQTAAEKLLDLNPEIILFSVYIWNLTVTTETVTILRTLRPDLKIVIGGPEVSHDYEDLSLFKNVDHLIRGEGECVIEKLCRNLLTGSPRSRTSATTECRAGAETPPVEEKHFKNLPKVINAPPADLKTVALPYDEYTDEDLAHRRLYIESSRGCPFSCEYCLSALEDGIRFFPPENLFPMFGKLIERGGRIFKFIDRSFNANPAHAAEVFRPAAAAVLPPGPGPPSRKRAYTWHRRTPTFTANGPRILASFHPPTREIFGISLRPAGDPGICRSLPVRFAGLTGRAWPSCPPRPASIRVRRAPDADLSPVSALP